MAALPVVDSQLPASVSCRKYVWFVAGRADLAAV